MLRRLLIIATALLLTAVVVSPGRASAAEPGVVLGERAFGKLACGTPTVTRATFAALDVLAGADPTACSILLNREYAPHMPRAMRCTLVLHEYGHLAGRPHVHDEGSVMNVEYVRDDPRCISATRVHRASSRAGRARGTSGTARRSG